MLGAGVLAFNAGVINAIGFLGIAHQAITHLTGTSTLFGIAVGNAEWSTALHMASVVGAFVAGSALSGLIIRDSALRLGRRYGGVLALESLMLISAMLLLQRDVAGGDLLLSAACGLQNAMASSYSGAVLRTTHLSGSLTDIGILVGQWMAHLPIDRRRLRLLCLLVSGFVGGAVAGGQLYAAFGYSALYLPIALTGCSGFAYVLYRHVRPVRADAASGSDQ